MLKGTAAPLPRLATIVRMHEEERYPYTDEERNTIATVVKAVRHAIITRREAERPGSVQARTPTRTAESGRRPGQGKGRGVRSGSAGRLTRSH